MKGFFRAVAHKLSTIDKRDTGKETVFWWMRHASANTPRSIHQATVQGYWSHLSALQGARQ